MEVKTIACGLSHSGLVTADGQVFIWGLSGNLMGHSEKLLEHFLHRTPKLVSFKHLFEREPGINRRKSTTEQQTEVSKAHPPSIEDLHLGEYFSLA
jgi:alpha-tubulin suppressor-like RCC1 family protein